MKLKNKKILKFLNLHQVNYLFMRAHSYLKIFNNLPIKVALLQPKKSKGRLLSNMAAETCLLLVLI